MNKTRIEWCDYTINPVKGLCPMACSYCYAKAMYKRFKWNPEIRFVKERLIMPSKPSRFFVGSTMELFAEWIKPEWMVEIFAMTKCHPQHTFIFLTKQPQNLIKWSPFPKNCWVGVTATDFVSSARVLYTGFGRIEATVKFISFEPLLGETKLQAEDLKDVGINWLIIGQQTPISAKTQPKRIWIDEIIGAAKKARIPVFLKDNLKMLFKSISKDNSNWAFMANYMDGGKFYTLRQELPK